MAPKKTEVYLELSAQLEHVFATMAEHKARLMEEVSKYQAEFNERQARINEQLSKWEGLTKEATDKLTDLRNGPEEGSELERKRNDASSAISRLKSAV
jgi:hypothetical protein